MRSLFAAFLLGASLLGCTCPNVTGRPLPAEVEPQCAACVADCLRLGMLAETADAGNPFGSWAACRMEHRLQARAERLKATHIVWLHRTPYSAAAEVYRCPVP